MIAAAERRASLQCMGHVGEDELDEETWLHASAPCEETWGRLAARTLPCAQ